MSPRNAPSRAMNVEPLRRVVGLDLPLGAAEVEAIALESIGVGDHREYGGAEHVAARPMRGRQGAH